MTRRTPQVAAIVGPGPCGPAAHPIPIRSRSARRFPCAGREAVADSNSGGRPA